MVGKPFGKSLGRGGNELNGRWRSWKKFAGRKLLKLEPLLELYGDTLGFGRLRLRLYDRDSHGELTPFLVMLNLLPPELKFCSFPAENENE